MAHAPEGTSIVGDRKSVPRAAGMTQCVEVSSAKCVRCERGRLQIAGHVEEIMNFCNDYVAMDDT